MGGCASKPKELNNTPATLPGETPLSRDPTLKDAEVETPAQEQKDGAEAQKEEPLVDLSEPTPKDSTDAEAVAPAEPKTVIDDLVSGIADQSNEEKVTAEPTEEKVEAGNETVKQIKDEAPVADLAEKTTEAPKADVAVEEKVSTPETSEKKAESPVVSV